MFGMYVIMFALGAAMGSFVACQAWRARYREQGRKSPGKRSVCLKCGHKLSWYENIPIVSWLALRGKCAKCGRKIGTMEILAEVLMGLAFVGLTWATEAQLMIGWGQWLGIITPLCAMVMVLGWLAIYDGMWGELPSVGLWLAGGVAVVVMVARWISDGMVTWGSAASLAGAVAILGGTYLILYLVSRGKWVGNGDYILGTIIALVLGEAWLALVTLFIANALGCIVMWPTVKKRKSKKIYFGPFMVIAFVVVMIFSNYLMLMVKW